VRQTCRPGDRSGCRDRGSGQGPHSCAPARRTAPRLSGSISPAPPHSTSATSNTTGKADVTVSYGNPGWVPVTGDWDGNGTTTVGAYNPKTATFYLRNSNTTGKADVTLSYGNPGWVPVVGDWDGKQRPHLRLGCSRAVGHDWGQQTAGLDGGGRIPPVVDSQPCGWRCRSPHPQATAEGVPPHPRLGPAARRGVLLKAHARCPFPFYLSSQGAADLGVAHLEWDVSPRHRRDRSRVKAARPAA